MKIALLVFGQFRAYEQVLESNILELKKAFPASFDIYVLTDKLPKGLYSPEAEAHIRSRFVAHDITIKLFEFWENLTHLHATDKVINEYNHQFLNTHLNGKPIDKGHYWMMNLWYRRFVLWKLFEQQKGSYDYCIFNRLFDTSIRLLRPICEDLNPHTLFASIDTFFIASPPIMKTLMNFGKTTENWLPVEWTPEFTAEYMKWDTVLPKNKDTFCSETQLFRWILGMPWKNIRFDFTTQESPSHATAYFDIRHVRTYRLPKKIFQIALTAEDEPHPNLKQSLEGFNHDYTYTLLRHEDCIKFLDPDLRPLFDNGSLSEKTDLIRRLYLFKHGGWYFAPNAIPLLPLTVIYEKTGAAKLLNCVKEDAKFIAAAPGLAAEAVEPADAHTFTLRLLEDGRQVICQGEEPLILLA